MSLSVENDQVRLVMSEVPISVASAVLPPEPQQVAGPASASLKRRQSSESFSESKRRRTSQDESTGNTGELGASPTTTQEPDQVNKRRRTGQLEERKRGQRLFGALLGTLSQSSSSTANNRRADIEKKQRTKLKEQTEEGNERRKARLEELILQRRKEQRVFDGQSLKRRHQSMLAHAQFLLTKTEPRLYYKPWELLSGEEAIINDQIEEVKELIDGEVRDFEASSGRDVESNSPTQRNREDEKASPDEGVANGKITNTDEPVIQGINGVKQEDLPMRDAPTEVSETVKQKDIQDDGGDVVEGEEDTVIY